MGNLGEFSSRGEECLWACAAVGVWARCFEVLGLQCLVSGSEEMGLSGKVWACTLLLEVLGFHRLGFGFGTVRVNGEEGACVCWWRFTTFLSLPLPPAPLPPPPSTSPHRKKHRALQEPMHKAEAKQLATRTQNLQKPQRKEVKPGKQKVEMQKTRKRPNHKMQKAHPRRKFKCEARKYPWKRRHRVKK